MHMSIIIYALCNPAIHFVLVYNDEGFGYLSIVQEIAVKAMADARSEVQGTQNYIVNGDVSKLTQFW